MLPEEEAEKRWRRLRWFLPLLGGAALAVLILAASAWPTPLDGKGSVLTAVMALVVLCVLFASGALVLARLGVKRRLVRATALVFLGPLGIALAGYGVLLVALQSCGSPSEVTATWNQPSLYEEFVGNSTGWEPPVVHQALEGRSLPTNSLRIKTIAWTPEDGPNGIRFEYGEAAVGEPGPARVEVRTSGRVNEQELRVLARAFVDRLGAGANADAVVAQLVQNYSAGCRACYEDDQHGSQAPFAGYADLGSFFDGLAPKGGTDGYSGVYGLGPYYYVRWRSFDDGWKVTWNVAAHVLEDTVNGTRVKIYASPIRVNAYVHGAGKEISTADARDAVNEVLDRRGLALAADAAFKHPCYLM